MQPPVEQVLAAAPVVMPPVIEQLHNPVADIQVPPVVEAQKFTPEPEKTEEPKQPVFTEQRIEQTPPVPFVDQILHQEHKADDAAKGGLRFYSPLVKNIAAQEGISNTELDQIPGTGAEGRLTKDDLLAYLQNKFKPGIEPQNTPVVTEEAVKENMVTESVIDTPIPVINSIETPEPGPVAETLPEEQVAETPQPEPAVSIPVAETPKPEPKAEPVSSPEPTPAKPAVTESKPVSSSSMTGGDEIIEMDRMRRLIADHMVMSMHTAPHVTSFVEADVTNLVLWREKIKSSFEKKEGEKITFTPIFIEAVVRAIKDYPMINISVNGTQIIKKKDINISMATALPSGNLIVPVIKKADELSLLGITKAVNDLASRARNNKLKPDDIQGGTFTITNVGSFGNVMGTPIINQPQVAILAVGAIKKKPAVIETLQGDMIGIRHMMFLSLSYDHRVVDGSLGGSFVRRIADYLENWDLGREI